MKNAVQRAPRPAAGRPRTVAMTIFWIGQWGAGPADRHRGRFFKKMTSSDQPDVSPQCTERNADGRTSRQRCTENCKYYIII
ncbi:hypothetical protein EYF80_066618 [Liparis tanakae]|uniref:Uncharacterized protein n=1 Tax=Liparis tanakae TaxID=230148 RepID=A0A4Z2E3G7_9TELE|nr:hypothetical protein EYF80_066618 [Liparis tanakae]